MICLNLHDMLARLLYLREQWAALLLPPSTAPHVQQKPQQVGDCSNGISRCVYFPAVRAVYRLFFTNTSLDQELQTGQPLVADRSSAAETRLLVYIGSRHLSDERRLGRTTDC